MGVYVLPMSVRAEKCLYKHWPQSLHISECTSNILAIQIVEFKTYAVQSQFIHAASPLVCNIYSIFYIQFLFTEDY